jgi:mRNA interferase MazF
MNIFIPVPKSPKGYPFEVDIRGDSHVSGVVLSDQVKCLDWQARGIRKKGVASRAELEETLEKLKTLLE